MEQIELSQTVLATRYGSFELSCANFGPCEQDNILVLRSGDLGPEPLCRIQSACYTAEIFRSLDCDCHEQLDESLKRIARDGGLLLYMLCDGRGAGLLTKIKGLELTRVEGIDTAEAYRRLGVPDDPRTYERAAAVLGRFGVEKVRLLTNNPRKPAGLKTFGLKVTREPLEILATPQSESYLRAKWQKLGHLFQQFYPKR